MSAFIYSGCTEKSDNESSGEKTEEKSPELSAKGKEIFYAVSTETGLKCADCHSDGTNDNVTLTKFYSPVNGVPKRTSTYHGMFKGEEVKNTAGGSTICWERYLGYEDKMTPEQIDALNAYFTSIATDSDPTEIAYETLALPERDKDKFKTERDRIIKIQGDLSNGERIFKEACASCHSENSGVENIPDLREYEGNEKGVVYNVLLGDEHMPFFRRDKLSDQDIADIAAFIMTKVVQKK